MRITHYYLLIFYTKISLNLSAFLVVSPPSFAEEPQDTWFNLNKSTSNLSCVANDYPDPVNYQWMCDNEILSEFTNSTYINVDKYGAYTCLLSNSFGTVRSRTALVQEPVIRYQKMVDVHKNINNGGYLFLPSLEVFESIPPVEEVFWQKKESQEWKNVVQKDLYTKNGSLLIRKVSEEHNGSFRYIIKQKSGHSRVGYQVTINITGTVSDNTCENISYALLELPTHVTVYAGQDISIECLAFFYRCSQPPGFGWYHNYPSKTKIISNKAVLNILNSTSSDSGNYSCEVRPPTNKYMPRTLVTVLVKPALNISTSKSAIFYINNDDPITIDIVVLTSSVGLKSYEWYFNGKSLSGNSKYNYTADHKLIVNQPIESDSGIYQVFYFFDGLELNHVFNVFVVKNKSIMVADSLTATLMSSRVSTINFKSVFTEDVKGSSFLLASTFSSTYISLHSKNLSISTEDVKVSSFILSSTFLSTYIPLDQSILSFSQHFLSSLLSSSFELSCLVSSSALSCQPEATLSTFVVEKKQIKNNTLIISLSTGSAILIFGMLIGLIMRKRCSVKKDIKKERVEEMAMCEIKTKGTTETAEIEYDYVTVPKSQSLDELLENTPNLNSDYKSQENPYYG